MRYKERVIKHNIDIPELRTVGYSDMTEIYYDPSVISHHPRSFEYYFTHGIVVNEKRYIIKEFFVRESKLYAVITEDEVKYYELYLSFMEEDTIERIKKELEELDEQIKNIKIPEAKQNQTLALSGRVISISDGNSVTLPEYESTKYTAGSGININNGVISADIKTQSVKSKPYTEESITLKASERHRGIVSEGLSYGYAPSAPNVDTFTEHKILINYDLQIKNPYDKSQVSTTRNNVYESKFGKDNIIHDNINIYLHSDEKNEVLLNGKLSTTWNSSDRFIIELSPSLIYNCKYPDVVRSFRHKIIYDELDSGEPIYISIMKNNVEVGYVKLTINYVKIERYNYENNVLVKDTTTNNYRKVDSNV